MTNSMALRKSYQNPVLEIKRDAYLAEEKSFRDDLVELYKCSILKVKHLHASLLFTTKCGYLILKEICRLVTQVDSSVNNNSWRDLAVNLGYTDLDVKCINNLRGNIYDPTEVMLKYYAGTKKEGTIGNILQALLDLGFLPALHQAQQHIDGLLSEVAAVGAVVIKAPKNADELEVETKAVLKASSFKPFVPAIFNSSLPSKKVSVGLVNHSVDKPNFETEVFQRAAPQSVVNKNQEKKQYCKYVILSFAEDGYTTALKVANVLRATKNKKGFPIGVLVMCENEDLIQANPGQILPEILSKIDFVIPILTEGYFAALKHPNPQARLIDERFIQFIHDILVSKYIHNNCFNLQVRPIIPNQLVNSIYNKPEFVHNTILKAWKTDDELSVLAGNIVKSKRSKIMIH